MDLLRSYLQELGAKLAPEATGTFSGSYVQELKLRIEDLEDENKRLLSDIKELRVYVNPLPECNCTCGACEYLRRKQLEHSKLRAEVDYGNSDAT